jgi:hypothetical protein
MEITFRHPYLGRTLSAPNPEQLARMLADLPPGTHVQLMTAPFPIDSVFLGHLKVQFSHERLAERLTFECAVDPAQLTAEACEQLRKLKVTHLRFSCLPHVDFEPLRQALTLAENADIAVALQLQFAAAPTQPQLQRLYWFLYELRDRVQILGSLPTVAAPIQKRLETLIAVNNMLCRARFMHQRFLHQAYMTFYTALKTQLSHNVKTILEINPYGQEQYYREFPWHQFPRWKVTSLHLPRHALDIESLKKMGKTFDAVVLFNAFDAMRDPKRDLLQLQKYTRPTTEWAFSSFHIPTLPNLFYLLCGDWSNALKGTPAFESVRFFGHDNLLDLFKFLGLQVQLTATPSPPSEFAKEYQQIRALLHTELGDQLTQFEQNAEVFLYSGIGTQQVNDEFIEEDGFISSGFLS